MDLLRTAILAALICPAFLLAKSEREERLNDTFLLRHRETGSIKEFHRTNQKQAKKALLSAGVDSSSVRKCNDPPGFPDSQPANSKQAIKKASSKSEGNNVSEDLVLQKLELSILIEAFSTREQTGLTDSQLDSLQTLDLCDAKTRNGLRAIGLVIENYELLKAAEI
jgi:hypothetical protein